MNLKTEECLGVMSENIAAEVLEQGLEKEILTPEQINLKISREGSWLNALFQQYNLTADDKREIIRRVAKLPKT